jgi:hypothetical protein
VGENSGVPGDQDRDVVFYSLGAKPTKVAPTMMAEAFEKGHVGAAVYEPSDKSTSEWQNRSFGFTVYATEFQPRVGVFSSSLEYWNELSEADKMRGGRQWRRLVSLLPIK